MPTRSEVASYTLGVRLSQALAISTPGGRVVKAELQAAIERLRQAFENLARSFRDFDPVARRRGHDVLENCWSSANQISSDPDDVSDPEFIRCFDQLKVLRQIVSAALTYLSLDGWLQLGFEIAKGCWHDPDSHPRYIDEPKPQTRTVPRWVLDDPSRVEELSRQLSVSWEQLFPEGDESGFDPELFSGVPWADAGWHTIEAGLRALATTTTSDRHAQQGEPMQPVNPLQLAGNAPVSESALANRFVRTPIHDAILDALNGRALNADELAAASHILRRNLFDRGPRTGPLTELRSNGLVDHHRRLGYFRPDSLPPELRENGAPE